MGKSVEVTEATSKYLTSLKNIDKESENVLSMASQMVGAVSGNELDQMVSRALSAAFNLVAFAKYFLDDGTVEKSAVQGNYNKLLKAADAIKLIENKCIKESVEITESEMFIDPYESEYLPAEMLSGPKDITENVIEDADPLPDDLDDDPDAVYTLNPDGMPVKFNNTPIELDPFALKLFRNNAELIDPPEVFDVVSDADKSVEPDIEPGTADEVTIDDADSDQVIDVIADAVPKDEEEKTDVTIVELPPDDFDVFANESKVVESPKSPVLPPQFSQTEAKRANENIAENPGNNLKMLSFLTQDWC